MRLEPRGLDTGEMCTWCLGRRGVRGRKGLPGQGHWSGAEGGRGPSPAFTTEFAPGGGGGLPRARGFLGPEALGSPPPRPPQAVRVHHPEAPPLIGRQREEGREAALGAGETQDHLAGPERQVRQRQPRRGRCGFRVAQNSPGGPSVTRRVHWGEKSGYRRRGRAAALGGLWVLA